MRQPRTQGLPARFSNMAVALSRPWVRGCAQQDNRLTREVNARQPVVLQHTRTREGEYNGNYT